MAPRQRDILLIPVPFTDLTSVKRRPVLVLSNNAYNRTSQDIIVAAITSKVTDGSQGVLIEASDLERGMLTRTSLVCADKIYTLNKEIVIKRFGKLKAEKYQVVIDAIQKLIE